jgi:tetratricopeptide (TPR) repeat protein
VKTSRSAILGEVSILFQFSIRFAKMMGSEKFDDAIDYLRDGLKGDMSDLAAIEMIAHCHRWAGRPAEAIAVCHEALAIDPASFDMHSTLAELFAEKREYHDAALHARKGLETYPEKLPELPRAFISVFNAVCWIAPSFRSADPELAMRSISARQADWFRWAKQYLSWYDANHGGSSSLIEH